MASYINVIFGSDKTGQAFKTFSTAEEITSSRLQDLHNKMQSSLVRLLFTSLHSFDTERGSSSHQMIKKRDRKRAMKGQEDECLEKEDEALSFTATDTSDVSKILLMETKETNSFRRSMIRSHDETNRENRQI